MDKKTLGKQIIIEFRKFLTSIIIIVSSAVIGFMLLLLVNTLSTDKVSSNVSEMIATEGFSWNSTDSWTTLDGYTDNLMMNIAAFPRQESLVRHTLLVPYADYYGGANMMSHLTDLVNGREITSEYTTYYGRYWHGYLIILKPLLSFMNYGQIRSLNMFLMILLLFFVEHNIIKAYGMAKGLAYLSIFLCINPISAMLCMQYSTVTYICLISTLVLLMVREKSIGLKDIFFLYLLTGVTVAYFDLLTFPLVTLGTLLITDLLVGNDKCFDGLISRLYSLVRYSSYWCLGYFGMWGSKHLMVAILTDYDIWLDVKATAYTRIKGGDLDLSIGNILTQNVRIIVNSPVFALILALLSICILIMLVDKHKRNATEDCKSSKKNELTSYLVIAVYPLVWYTVLRNHSLTHSWLTFRELAITVYAIIAFVVDLMERRPKSRND